MSIGFLAWAARSELTIGPMPIVSDFQTRPYAGDRSLSLGPWVVLWGGRKAGRIVRGPFHASAGLTS